MINFPIIGIKYHKQASLDAVQIGVFRPKSNKNTVNMAQFYMIHVLLVKTLQQILQVEFAKQQKKLSFCLAKSNSAKINCPHQFRIVSSYEHF